MTTVVAPAAARFSLQMPSTTLGSLDAIVHTIADPPASHCPT